MREKVNKFVQTTVHRIHFEEYGGNEFERLAYAYLFNTLSDHGYFLEWLGQSGTDGGRDIWAQKGEESHCYQCANYRKFSLRKVVDDIDTLIAKGTVPSKFILISGGPVSAISRSKVKAYANKNGIKESEVWAAVEFEERLRKHTPNVFKRFVEGDPFPEAVLDVELIILSVQSTEQPQQTTVEPLPQLPKRKVYRFNLDYIPRTITPLIEDQEISDSANLRLAQICKIKNRVILLSSAGMGKSVELEHLAEEYSGEVAAYTPILIRLNLYAGEEIEYWISRELPNWNAIKPYELLLIFDGLDEIHINLLEIAIKKLIAFSHLDKYQEAKIVVSCRDNFYNEEFGRHYSGKQPFFVLKLKELSYYNLTNHINTLLGSETGVVFIKMVREKQMADIITNPFFLNYLLDIFGLNGTLPSSTVELMESLIDHRIRRDHERSATLGINLSRKSVLIRSEIERIALIMEANGKNYLTENEFQLILPDVENKRILIEHSFLFDRAKDGIWQFEHNNFQEYLAAKKIQNKSLDRIKSLVAIQPDMARVKPTWVNTLSFLFLLTPVESQLFNELVDWILESDKELLLKIEKERLDLRIREKLFKGILESYQDKGIHTRSTRFDLRSLAKFVSDSKDILGYLIHRLREDKRPLVKSELQIMLSEFERVNEVRRVLQPILSKNSLNRNLNEVVRYHSIHALASLKWQSKLFFRKMLKSLDLQHSQYDRAGVYRYLLDSGFLEEELELILKLIEYEGPPGAFSSAQSVDLGDENIYRDECLQAIITPAGIARMLNYFTDSIVNNRDEFLVRNHLHDFLIKANDQYLMGNLHLFDNVINSLLSLQQSYRLEEYGEFFKEFFQNSGTLDRACLHMYEHDGNANSLAALAAIVDRNFVLFMVEELRSGRLTDAKATKILHELASTHSRVNHDLFYDAINKITGDRFQYPVRVDWMEINAQRNYRDLDLILDKGLFLKSVVKIFELEKVDVLDKKHLIDFRRIYMRGQEVEIPRKLTTSFRDKLTTKSYFTI